MDEEITDRARRFVDAAETDTVTESLLVGGEEYTGEFFLYGDAPIERLRDDERPQAMLFNDMKGVGIGSKRDTVTPEGAARSVFVVTDDRVLLLVGQQDGDWTRSIPFEDVLGAEYHTGFMKHRVVVDSGDGRYHLWVDASYEEADLAETVALIEASDEEASSDAPGTTAVDPSGTTSTAETGGSTPGTDSPRSNATAESARPNANGESTRSGANAETPRSNPTGEPGRSTSSGDSIRSPSSGNAAQSASSADGGQVGGGRGSPSTAADAANESAKHAELPSGGGAPSGQSATDTAGGEPAGTAVGADVGDTGEAGSVEESGGADESGGGDDTGGADESGGGDDTGGADESGGGDDPLETLERLKELHDKDVLTDEEFEAKKADLLDQI